MGSGTNKRQRRARRATVLAIVVVGLLYQCWRYWVYDGDVGLAQAVITIPERSEESALQPQTQRQFGPVRFVVPHHKQLKWTRTDEKIPFVVVACLFSLQAILSFIALSVSRITSTSLASHSIRFVTSLKAYAYISSFSALFYVLLSIGSPMWVVGSMEEGHWIISRSLHWHCTTPVQLYIFAQSAARPRPGDCMYITVNALLTQFFGLVMLLVRPMPLILLAFALSSLAYTLMFVRLVGLRLLPDVASIGSMIRTLYLVLWTIYPLVTLLRYADWISDWTEQVLFYSVLDVVTKSITFGGLVIIRFGLNMLSMQASSQLALATNDMVLAVDESFQVLDSMRTAPLVTYYFGDILSSFSIVDLCYETDRQRLIDVARTADTQTLDAPTPKCTVQMILPDNRTLHVEVLVSKQLRAQRILGLIIHDVKTSAVAPSSDGTRLLEDAIESVADSCLDLPTQSKQVSNNPQQPDSLQLLLAIHNCSSVLQLSAQSSERLFSVFLNQWNMCGLIFFHGRPEKRCSDPEPHTIAMSPLLESVVGGNISTHPRLADWLGESVEKQIVTATKQKDLVLLQTPAVLANGVQYTVSVMPLTRLSRQLGASDINLCLVLLEAETDQQLCSPAEGRRDETGSQGGSLFWYPVSGCAVCVRASSATHRVLSPLTVKLPRSLYGSQTWVLFHEVMTDAANHMTTSSAQDNPEEETVHGREGCQLAFALPMTRRLVEVKDENMNTTRTERMLLASMSQGLSLCTKAVPKPMVEFVTQSCKA